MAKIQWPKNPQIGDSIEAYFGGAWVWDGCMWEHSCCPTPVCDYITNGGINMIFNLNITSEAIDLGGATISIYYWLEYIGSYSGTPKFETQFGPNTLVVEWDGSQWIFIASNFFDTETISGSAPELTGPWTLDTMYGDFGIAEDPSLQFECGPYIPRCINIEDSVNGYSETQSWIPVVYTFGNTKFYTYLALGGDSAISMGDLPVLLNNLTGNYEIGYEFYYLSPTQPGFNMVWGQAVGANNDQIPTGVFTYNSYGENIIFTVTENPGYTCEK